MENTTLLGVDIAKNVFQLHGVDDKGKLVLRRKLTRYKLVEFIAKLSPRVIAMEACGGSNYWYRKFKAMGHEVRLISPQFVKPFVKSNKSDVNDAEAICEAASRPSTRYISPKSIEQQDLQAVHRIRTRLVEESTALINQIRGLLAEYGVIIPKGISQVRKKLLEILEDAENELSHFGRELFFDLYEQAGAIDKKIEEYNLKLESIFASNELCQRISKIEGIGIINATAVVAAIGDPKTFKNGRHFSAFLGLVPKQCSSGGKERLLGISKRGDSYIRTLLIHGARSVVKTVGSKEDPRSQWIRNLKERRGANRTAVALANKNARIIWALLAKEKNYEKAA